MKKPIPRAYDLSGITAAEAQALYAKLAARYPNGLPTELPPPPPSAPAGRTPTAKPITTMDRQRFREQEIILEDGRRLGDCLDPWQREDFLALDDPRHRHAYLERPRGHSKTSDVGSECVTELVLGGPGRQIIAVAGDEDQARLLLDDVKGKFERNTRLRPLAQFKKNEIRMKASGSALRIMAADAPSSYGLRPDLIVCDEIAEWRRRDLWDSLWTASGKRPHCRVLVISSAGWDTTSICAEVRKIAESEEDWYFSSRGQCASWIRRAWLQQQKRTLPDHVYQRLHENRWVTGAGCFFLEEEIDRIFVNALPATGGPHSIGLDLGLSRDRSVISLLRADAHSNLICVDHLATYVPQTGSRVDLSQVEEDVAELATRTGAGVTLDPWQGVLLATRLRARGIAVEEFAFTSETRRRLFGSLLDLVRTDGLRCRPHPELRKELLSLEVQETPSGWRVDHRVGRHDDHVIAVALAIGGLWDLPAAPLELQEGEDIPASEYGGNFMTGEPAPNTAPAWWPR